MQPSLILKKLVDTYVAERGCPSQWIKQIPRGGPTDELWALAIGTVYPPPPVERASKPQKVRPPLAPAWWMGGTTCHQHTSVAWTSECGRFVLLRHWGHSEWCGGGSGQQYCEAHHTLFDMERVDTSSGGVWSREKESLATWTGRWTKAKQERMEELCNPWK